MTRFVDLSRLLRFAVIGLVFVVLPSISRAQTFQASLHEASWRVTSSVFECSISQAIPLFGEARFYHRAGEDLTLQLLPFGELLSFEMLHLKSMAPPWRAPSEQRQLGVRSSESESVIQFEQSVAKLIIAELLHGMVPSISGESMLRQGTTADVFLSPVRFQMAYSEYQGCSNNLLAVNYDQIHRTTLFWPSGARALTAQARARLDNVIRYAEADPSIVGFEVDSFTDTVGERRENLLFSEERAFLVTNYLINNGIDPEKIATRAHGEREEYLIVNPEKTQADRDRNRRVNIVLLRDMNLTSMR